MKCRTFLTLSLIAIATPALAAAPVAGKWLTTERDSIIEIGQCGETLCGKVLRVLKAAPGGKPAVDFNNPEASLRTRPLTGLPVLTGFTDDGDAWKGKIYDPKSGKSYKSFVTLNPDATLKVQGCIGFICRTFIWTAVH